MTVLENKKKAVMLKKPSKKSVKFSKHSTVIK